MRTKLFILQLALVGAIAVNAQVLDLPYSSGSSGADGPFTLPDRGEPTYLHGLAYDEEREVAVKFGGRTASGLSNATWTYDGQTWLRKTPEVSPPPREGCGMAYDAIRKKVVMFGGYASSGALADTWTWDGSNWTQLLVSVVPPARTGATLTWDAARGNCVLFGGSPESIYPPPFSATFLQDTWVWDGSTWNEKFPAVRPSGRAGAAAAYYPPWSEVFLTSGRVATQYNSVTKDIWSWDGTNWNSRGNITGTGPLLVAGAGSSLAYDQSSQSLFLFGGWYYSNPSTNHSYLLRFQGGVWSIAASCPETVGNHSAVWFPKLGEMVAPYGGLSTTNNAPVVLRNNTWAWDGSNWFIRTGPSNSTFDLRTKSDGIWNFTTISIPNGHTVGFRRDGANNSVLWLASEDVNVSGTINLSGLSGAAQPSLNAFAAGGKGGPGAFDGGSCGPATVGMGPGGGPSGARPASNGVHADAMGAGPYGTLFAQPALGGSGGGGHNGAGGTAGGSGGGGGGAIVIASSKDINVTGTILVKGGTGGGINATGGYGGDGSGGLVRLVGDRVVLGPAALIDASDTTATGKGRVRIEGYVRQIPNAATQLKGSSSASVPVQGSVLNQAGGRLRFVKVHGQNVANPPGGNELNPDVVFTATGDVEIEVHAINIPDGTPVTVTINHSLAGVIALPAVTLLQCKAVFTATVPAGSGVMQAFATYNVGGPTGTGEP